MVHQGGDLFFYRQAVLAPLLQRPVAMRQAVAHPKAALGVSERRACSIIKADRKSVRYRSYRQPDMALRERLLALAYRAATVRLSPAVFVLLRREGEPSGKNRIYRLYRQEGLTVRKRLSRRRSIGTRAPILIETRECLQTIPDTLISGRRVARELTALIARRGRPAMIVSDNGMEFTSTAILAWT